MRTGFHFTPGRHHALRGDVVVLHAELHGLEIDARAAADRLRATHADTGCEVVIYKRSVKAGGADIRCFAVVARTRPIEIRDGAA